ncbi:Voltage-dependent calcium channel type D subunit alpha-1 [Symbiodinium microadriaticum]|uniref:Voltage-dependent calcium channel type D subunit alpha-1 n=1 Tax=Symbiodinium microadriaticum TaxID=2951 RepID=A0A1Q9EXB2_SYMMI|nr:Voltage-dependent calcium channel type D subunit alpha-1 [Symbiodinium microadriaticum]
MLGYGTRVLVLLLIVANAVTWSRKMWVLLGVEIDVASTLPESDIPSWYGMVNTLIVAFFVLDPSPDSEIAMKFFAYGCSGFWRGPGSGWNIFDFVIVALSAVETALDLFAKTIASEMFGSDALSVVRTLRLARALRGFRAFRLVRHFSALRALILSIVSTIGSLMWTLVLLVILFYSFGVILMQLVTDYCFWSSIRQSMLTLFFSITSGISWSEAGFESSSAMNPLEDVSMLAVGTMLVYITLSVFTILNVVTGVFVNTAIERASADKEIASLKEAERADGGSPECSLARVEPVADLQSSLRSSLSLLAVFLGPEWNVGASVAPGDLSGPRIVVASERAVEVATIPAMEPTEIVFEVFCNETDRARRHRHGTEWNVGVKATADNVKRAVLQWLAFLPCKVEDIEAAVNVDKLDTVLVPGLFSESSQGGMKALLDGPVGRMPMEAERSTSKSLWDPQLVQMAKMSYENKRIASSIKTLMTQVKDMQKKMNTVLSMRTAVPMTIPVHDDVMYI